ncbi:MAG: DoxX family protein [Flavobacteriia bacterium]|nr:DoxX family protein [Flavobacteriia bacterium]
MTVLLLVLGGLLAFAAIGSGFAKLAKVPNVMQSMESVGVPANRIPLLAVLDIAGGLGLVVGIWNVSLGILSAVCLSLYFLGAVLSHLRKKHKVAEFGPAFVIFVIAVVVSVLEIQR